MEIELLREKVISLINLDQELTDELLHNVIDQVIDEKRHSSYISISNRCKIHKDIFDSIRGLGVLQELLDDDDVTEIMVNNTNNIFYEKNGRIKKYDGRFLSEERLEDVIQQIVGQANKRVNQSTPIVDTRLPDGSRVNVVLAPVAIEGSTITIRKFPKESITMEQLIKFGSITPEAAKFLEALVRAKYNIFVSGGTGSGKTTFLNVLSDFIPSDERVITIEDSAELKLQNVTNLVRMEVRQENTEGNNKVTIRDLIRTSLRMRPDRIIVGEVRGEEALDMLQAMNTGHEGSMSTGHSNSAVDMLGRLEMMLMMATDTPLMAMRKQIASAIDIVVHLGRFRDKTRKVLEIDEVKGIKDGEIKLEPLFKWEMTQSGGELVKKSELADVEKLKFYDVEFGG